MAKWWARERAGFLATIQLKAGGAPYNLTGCTLAAKFARQAGSIDISLSMAANAAAEGFFITDAAQGLYQVRVLPATLQAIVDTTRDFTMFGDIILTTAGAEKFLVEDVEFQVTEGNT